MQSIHNKFEHAIQSGQNVLHDSATSLAQRFKS